MTNTLPLALTDARAAGGWSACRAAKPPCRMHGLDTWIDQTPSSQSSWSFTCARRAFACVTGSGFLVFFFDGDCASAGEASPQAPSTKPAPITFLIMDRIPDSPLSRCRSKGFPMLVPFHPVEARPGAVARDPASGSHSYQGRFATINAICKDHPTGARHSLECRGADSFIASEPRRRGDSTRLFWLSHASTSHPCNARSHSSRCCSRKGRVSPLS